MKKNEFEGERNNFFCVGKLWIEWEVRVTNL